MKTWNTYFSNYEHLDAFIKKHLNSFNGKNLLIQIFSGVIEKEFLEHLSSHIINRLPQCNIIGSTTDGEILNEMVSKKKVVLSFTLFERSTLHIAHTQNQCNSHSFQTGVNLSKALLKEDSKLFILFGAGLCLNGEEFLKGVYKQAPNITVAGGLSGDNANFKTTYIIANNQVQSTGAVGVSINSEKLQINTNYSFAWGNLGKEFTVNKSFENIIYEIDGMTPYKLYKKYLGKDIAKQLPEIGVEFPLIIQKNDLRIARAVLKLNEDGSMIFAGNVKEGSKVRFGIGNIEELLYGSSKLLHTLSKKYCESIFIYSCMARRRFLENKASMDIAHFSKLAPVSGFFTYGEFFSTSHNNELLNESLTLVALSEYDKTPKNIDIKKRKKLSKRLLKQKALSHIINTTSDELDKLNTKLEKKVKQKTKENIEQEKYILEQDKMAQMGEMIENIAHQWRQPLSAISSNASALLIQEQLGVLNNNETVKSMEKIIKDTKFLSDTIDTFRNFIQEKKETKTVVFQERLDLTLDIISTTLNDCNIELINEIDYSTPIIKTLTVGELSQVVLNVMNNAKDVLIDRKIKHPWIRIQSYIQKGQIITTIEDNGGGVPYSIMHKIFDPYFTTKHKAQGTGIGLYMSKNIIKKHFLGQLYVKNTKNGAKFFIEIPVEEST